MGICSFISQWKSRTFSFSSAEFRYLCCFYGNWIVLTVVCRSTRGERKCLIKQEIASGVACSGPWMDPHPRDVGTKIYRAYLIQRKAVNMHIAILYMCTCINVCAVYVQYIANFIVYGTRRFNASFTRTLHQSLSWAESNQFSVLILIHLRSF